MMETLHYLTHGTSLGILVLVLLFIGLTLISFSQISLHRHGSRSGSDGAHSHRVVGCGFIIAAIMVVLITWFLGSQPITSSDYEKLAAETDQIPEIKPYLEAYLAKRPVLNRMDYYQLQRDFEGLKRVLLVKQLADGHAPDSATIASAQ